MADLDALADRLAATVADLQAYIEARANEIAGPLITATQEKATGQVAEVEHAAAFQKQRDDDLIAELRRQLDAAVKSRDREFDELKRLRATVRAIEASTVCGSKWAGEMIAREQPGA